MDTLRFQDVVQANEEYAELFQRVERTGVAERGLAIVTCMDSRVDPLAIVGMDLGDVKILRNAAARATPDVMRGLVVAVQLLGVNRILLMPHTDCRLAGTTEDELHADLRRAGSIDTRSMEVGAVPDQRVALAEDLIRVRSHPFIPEDVVVAGGIYDVDSGRLTLLED